MSKALVSLWNLMFRVAATVLSRLNPLFLAVYRDLLLLYIFPGVYATKIATWTRMSDVNRDFDGRREWRSYRKGLNAVSALALSFLTFSMAALQTTLGTASLAAINLRPGTYWGDHALIMAVPAAWLGWTVVSLVAYLVTFILAVRQVSDGVEKHVSLLDTIPAVAFLAVVLVLGSLHFFVSHIQLRRLRAPVVDAEIPLVPVLPI
ncbi:hypothetical protein OBBRIDRAFT_837460 [Obba rivulosa]|uniref:Uncharacterized protein n=1 Tax=Obba rivulosa TaxID=1052685 RepID=A0A8E2ASG4_9APHY|nr:hypothetical protein OBBRIDRAFT_837460 [Obba rivulosa]